VRGFGPGGAAYPSGTFSTGKKGKMAKHERFQRTEAPTFLKTGKEAVVEEFSQLAEKLFDEDLSELRQKVESRKWRFYRYGYVSGRILDLGCGGGIDLIALHEITGGRAELYGVDITDKALELAKHRIRKLGVEGIHLLKGDIAALPFEDGFFDMVTVAWVLHHVVEEQLDQIFDEIKRVLRPGGMFLMLEPCEPPFTEEQWLWLELMSLQSKIELLVGRDFPRIHFTPRFTQTYLQRKGFEIESLEVITPYVGGFPMRAEFFKWELEEMEESISRLPEELGGHFQRKLGFLRKKIEVMGAMKGSTLVVKASKPEG